MPRTAMLLAAGLGTRMRPLTGQTAKPLLSLGGRALLDHALARLAEAGVEKVVVNAHWHAERVAAHLATRWHRPPERPGLGVSPLPQPPPTRSAGFESPAIVLRVEETLLDTGGAVRAALAELGAGPFFVVNGDSVWRDGPGAPALRRLADAWTADTDAMLLLNPTAEGKGDFFLDRAFRLRRPASGEIVPFLYAGVQLLHPRLFAGATCDTFSANVLWDRAIAAGRARGVVHDGEWFHLSTPADLARAEAAWR